MSNMRIYTWISNKGTCFTCIIVVDVDVFQAVGHLHKYNLVHMDIKPENIFVTDNNVAKLGDFGLVIDVSNVRQ